MAEGWIRLHRSIQDNFMWKDNEPFDKRSAWIDLLMLANYEDKKTAYKGKVITCKRGDVNLSVSALAERWHWGREKTRNFLKLLESDGMVTTKCTTHRTTVTIEKYGVFQDSPTTNRTTNRTTDRQQADTTNKEKKYKNNNNIKQISKSDKFSNFGNRQNYDLNALEEMLLKSEQ